MPWSRSQKIALVGAFLCVGVGVFVWRFTSGVSGEVFIVTDSGKAIVMPGAAVRLLKVNEPQAHQIMSNLGRRLDAYASEIDEHMSMLKSTPNELTMAHVKFANNLSATKYCLQLQTLGSESGAQGQYLMGNAGRDGRFSLSATPGLYLLEVSGEAGNTHAEWFQIVRLGWREELRLVQPTCSYAQNQ
jgi:hypothetical protein